MAHRDFGSVMHIFAEAIGKPGERQFRLQIIGKAGESASIWMEKEQLTALGDAIETALGGEGYQYQRLPLDDVEPPSVFPSAPDIDFRAGQLSLGLKSQEQQIVIIASVGDVSEGIQCDVDFRRSHELRRRIADVVAAGRAICPLCTGPIDPDGHVCVRTNGHRKQS